MLYKQIKNFKKRKPQMFCTPGHKGKMPRCFYAGLDITELSGTDNLYYPKGIIKEAQENAAQVFGVRELLFLTSGATQGIFAMLGAFKNQRVMIERGCHKSVFEACQLFNIEPVFDNKDNNTGGQIEAQSDGKSGSERPGCTSDVREGARVPHAAAINEISPPAARLVTYPDYYGSTIDIKTIYDDCKQKGIFLLADAAHGSHLGFSPRLPESVSPYCDAFVMSAHKTLPVLTQGAYLAINNSTLAQGIKTIHKNLGTTSPSYPIMASLDYAARYLKTNGEARLEKLFAAVQKFKATLPPEVKCCESDDFTRLVLAVADGFDFQEKLNAAGVYPEFADPGKVIFILSVCDTPSALRRLSKAIAAACRGGAEADSRINPQAGNNPMQESLPAPVRALPFLAAGNAPSEGIDITAAVGRTAAAEIGFYPPGIPLVIRGEVITKEICDIIKLHKDKLFGLTNGKVSVVI